MTLYTANELIKILKPNSPQWIKITEWIKEQREKGTPENLSVPAFHPSIDSIQY